MSYYQAIYGYILTRQDEDDVTIRALRDFPFDEAYPFPDRFGEPHPARGASMVAFGLYTKWLEERWDLWRARFHELLGALPSTEAEVIVSDEQSPTVRRFIYYALELPVPGAHNPRRWVCHRHDLESGSAKPREELTF
jgi:hypothetical protein